MTNHFMFLCYTIILVKWTMSLTQLYCYYYNFFIIIKIHIILHLIHTDRA